MSKCIFAWTEPTPPEGFPAYLNISQGEHGRHTVTVRSRGNGGRDVATVEVTSEVLDALLKALEQDCGDEGFHCGDPECDACVPAGVPAVPEALRCVDMPKPLQDALVAYHGRPCDAEAAAIVRAVLDAYGVTMLDDQGN